MRILVNNIRSTNSTLLVRMLKRIKRFPVEVWGSDVSKAGYIASSTFVDRYFQSPSIDNESEYLAFLKRLSDNYQIDLIFVSTDKEVRFMDKYNYQIKIPFFNPPSETINLFQNKFDASLAIEKLGVCIPSIYSNLFGKEKVIFRKKQSVSSEGIYVVDLSKATYIENHFCNDWFAQEYITGTTYVIDVFADKDGNPKLILPRQSIETLNGSAFRSKIVKNKELIDICKYIYSNFCIPGLSNIEFIENGGKYYFIEINLRIGGSATAGIIASFNYIEQYLDHFVNNNSLENLETYMNCVAWNSIISRYYEEVIIYK